MRPESQIRHFRDKCERDFADMLTYMAASPQGDDTKQETYTCRIVLDVLTWVLGEHSVFDEVEGFEVPNEG